MASRSESEDDGLECHDTDSTLGGGCLTVRHKEETDGPLLSVSVKLLAFHGLESETEVSGCRCLLAVVLQMAYEDNAGEPALLKGGMLSLFQRGGRVF